jgi:hypothetical protein
MWTFSTTQPKISNRYKTHFLKAQKIDPVTNIDSLLLKKEVHHSHRAIDGKGAWHGNQRGGR